VLLSAAVRERAVRRRCASTGESRQPPGPPPEPVGDRPSRTPPARV